MKVGTETDTKQKIENTDNQIQLQPEDTELLTAVNIPFADFLSQQMIENGSISNSSSNYNLKTDYNYDSLSMDYDDALFFVNLSQEGKFSVENNQNGDFKSLIQLDTAQNIVSKKSVEVTNQLTTLIEKSQKTQKPVRISFDNDVSVILKIDKQGKVSAEFIPGNADVESYLRNNIASLRQKFDEQNLPYNDLYYRQNGKQNKNGSSKNKGEE